LELISNNIRFLDYEISTSFKKGLAYRAKMKCKKIRKATMKTFTDIYPDYHLQVISSSIADECKWILKL